MSSSRSDVTRCPACGDVATLSITERVDVATGVDGHVIEFSCPTGCPAPDDATLLCLWAAVRGATCTATFPAAVPGP